MRFYGLSSEPEVQVHTSEEETGGFSDHVEMMQKVGQIELCRKSSDTKHLSRTFGVARHSRVFSWQAKVLRRMKERQENYQGFFAGPHMGTDAKDIPQKNCDKKQSVVQISSLSDHEQEICEQFEIQKPLMYENGRQEIDKFDCPKSVVQVKTEPISMDSSGQITIDGSLKFNSMNCLESVNQSFLHKCLSEATSLKHTVLRAHQEMDFVLNEGTSTTVDKSCFDATYMTQLSQRSKVARVHNDDHSDCLSGSCMISPVRDSFHSDSNQGSSPAMIKTFQQRIRFI